MAHWSDCPVNNAPVLPVGPCTCGNDAPLATPADWVFSDQALERQPPESNVVYGVDFKAKPAPDTACSEINPDSGDCA